MQQNQENLEYFPIVILTCLIVIKVSPVRFYDDAPKSPVKTDPKLCIQEIANTLQAIWLAVQKLLNRESSHAGYKDSTSIIGDNARPHPARII